MCTQSRPDQLSDASQAYFWSEAWQRAEREAERDLAESRTATYETVDELLVVLERNTD